MLYTAGSQVAQTIIASATANKVSLLCWDNSTDKDDILENLREYLHWFCGWDLLFVGVCGSTLEIREPGSLLLSYDLSTGREIYGRVSHMGLTPTMLDELKYLL